MRDDIKWIKKRVESKAKNEEIKEIKSYILQN